MRGRAWRWKAWIAVLIVGLALSVGCQSARRFSPRASRDWSRGLRLGQAALNERVSLVPSPTGEGVYLVWVTERQTDKAEFLRFVHLDRAGRVVTQRDLPLRVELPTQVDLSLDPSGALLVTWLDRVEDGQRLFFTLLDVQGQPHAEPQPISPRGMALDTYILERGPSGEMHLFWAVKEGQEPGLYYAEMSPQGEVSPPTLLVRKGFDPVVRTDSRGLLHLVWQEEPTRTERHIYYATVQPARRALSKPTEVATFLVPSGQSGNRVCLGLTHEDAYVFWSYERRGTAITPPTAETFYVAFPLGQPEAAGQERQVVIPALDYPAYVQQESPFRVRELARVKEGVAPSPFVYLPWTTTGQRAVLATAFAVQITTRTQSAVQIVLTLWVNRELQSYQIVTQMRGAALRPMLVADGRDNLHLSWLESAGFGTYEAHYGSAAPDVRAELNRITGQDVLDVALGLVWGLVQAMSLLPVALVWVVMPVILIVIYLFLRVEDELARSGPRIMLSVAILAYLIVKYLFRPNWLTALSVPRAWPVEVANVLAVVVPLLIITLASAVTYLYIRKHEFATLLPAFGLFVVTDVVATVLIYAPGIVGN